MPPRQTKCKIKAEGCEGLYTKWSITQKTCPNPACALELVKRDKEAKQRKADQTTRKRLMTRSDHIKAVQVVFNRFIRERDKDKLCICCNQPLGESSVGGGYDCGHYRSIGSAPHLRFNENNAAGQRKQCNRWGSGRAVDYRIGLIKRIGVEAVEALEAEQTPAKWTIDELIELHETYKQKLRDLR